MRIDEEVLKQLIQTNPYDIQSKVIYSRYMLENDQPAKAMEILEGINPKKNPSVEKLINDIRLWESDKKFLQALGIDHQSTSTKVFGIISKLSAQDGEKLYYAFQRFHIPMDTSSQKILGQKIAQGGNSILAGTILSSLPKEDGSKIPFVQVVEKKNPTSLSVPIHRESSKIVPIASVPITKSLDEQLKEALNIYSNDPSMKNIESVLYLYTQSGKTQEQIPFLKQHVQTHPFDYDVRLHIGKLLAWAGDYENALDYLYTIEGKTKNSAKLLIGQIYGWQGEYSAAKPILEEIEQTGTQSQRYDARKNLAYIARWQGDHTAARDIFADLHRENPSDEEVNEEVLFDQKQYSLLIAKYESLLRKNPNDLKSMERIAPLLTLNSEGERALFYYEKQYALTNNPNLLKEMGNVALGLKEAQKGLEYWYTYAKRIDTAQGWLEYGKNLYWSGRYQEALDTLRKIEDIPVVSAEVKELIALIMNKVSMNVSAPIDMNGSSIIAPVTEEQTDHAQATSYTQEAQFAEKMRKEGKFDQAARMYRLLYLRTSDPFYGQLYAQSLIEAGKVEEANAIYNVLVIESPLPTVTLNGDKTLLSVPLREIVSAQNSESGKSKIALTGERLTDTANLNAVTSKLIGEHTTSNQITLHGEVGSYMLKNQTDSLRGNSAFVSVGNGTIEGGVYADTIDSKAVFNPYLRISYPIQPHTISLTAHRRNAGFIKNAIKPLRDENTLTMVQLSDYALFPDNDEFWGAAEVAWDENGNHIFIPQFQYRFFQLPMEWLTWSVSFDGWYTLNSNPTNDYYSPTFADGTYLKNTVEIPLHEKIIFGLMGSLGYSFESEAYLYKVGGWIERPVFEGINFRVGCSDHKSISGSDGVLPYSYDMCDVKFLYNW